MVVIGIDFGNDSCRVTSGVKGKLVRIVNSENKKETP